ncbi:lipase (class 3) [Nitrosomonas sp. Nm84]|uniref:lipase family protein n=1 Tax=Nitrosomonas sp. Nm84 TaxID=200124 RepID=UPI000D9693CE|nr:lipase [Nitrosomonas sp. Nm84]PXW84930.1 lipase (class 3) [Nitrosomonas sp. Nm84]
MKNRCLYYVGLMSFVTLMFVASPARALPDDCVDLTASATFLETSGLVCLQKIAIAEQTDTQRYKATLQWLGIDNPGRFQLLIIDFDDNSELNSPIYSTTSGLLTLPKVDVPKEFGTERYAVSLTTVPNIDDSATMLFDLAKVEIYNNPDYVPNETWKPYGMLFPEERRAVDLLGRSIPYAQLADAIYDFDNATVGSWDLIVSIGKSSGMDAGVYKNRDTDELVLAFRGTETCNFPCSFKETEDVARDVVADAAIGTGTVSDQFKHAFNFAQDIVNGYPGSKITVTGHSLGGGLAQAVGATLGLETFAFNSSPVPDHFFDTYTITLPSEEIQELIHVIADIHDPVSNTDKTGKLYQDSHHVTPLIQFNFDLKEVMPSELADLNDLRFDRHSITRLYDNAVNLINNIYQAGW